MIAACGSQVRLATVALPMGGSATQPVGLDYGAVLAMGEALGADAELLAGALPGVEAAMLSTRDDDGGDEGEEAD